MPSVEVVITAFLGIALTASILSRRTRTPYTLVLVLFGIVLAASSVSTALGVDLIYDKLIGGGLFIGLVLPPLLFESMVNISSSDLSAVLRPSILLATAGVGIATVVVGLLLWQIAALPLYTSFLFAALIAPTDVATVLEVFRRAKVPTKLATLMETEAVFNDATAVVIFTLVLTSIGVSSEGIFQASLGFVTVLGGGIVVGLGIALGARLLASQITDSMTHTVLTIAAVYGSYAAASAIGASGLIAVAVTGLYFGNTVVRERLSGEAAVSIKSFWAVVALIANTIAFLYIGLSTDIGGLYAGLVPISIAYAAVIASRFASVYPFLGLKAISGERMGLSWLNTAVLGGMRGALSIVLVASVPDTIPSRGLMVTMTLGIAFISIVLQGPLLIRYIGKRFPKEDLVAKGSG